MEVKEYDWGTSYTGADAQNMFKQLQSQVNSNDDKGDKGDDWIKNNGTGEVKWFDGTGKQAEAAAFKHWGFFDSRGKTTNLGSSFFGTTGNTFGDYSQISAEQLQYLLSCSYKINSMAGVNYDFRFPENLSFEYLKNAFLGTPFGRSSEKGSEIPGVIWDYGGGVKVEKYFVKGLVSATAYNLFDAYLSSQNLGVGSDRASRVRADAVNYFKTTTVNYITPATLFNINLHKF
jgi:hypothetical protein